MSTHSNRLPRARRTALGLAAALAAGLVLPAASTAQELEEIIVTARRVEERLMDVPLAITAYDSEAIEAAGITSLQDVAELTPGLSFFNPLGENLPTPVIRGVVPQDIFGGNAAAIFVDGVYVAGREGLNFSQLDLERIEVLKGPQSSVYGRNAFSGAINYVTRAPSDVFESKAEVEGGNRGRQKVSAQVSGPIFTDTLTGRFSALYDEWDGSYDNTLAPENDIGGYRYRSLQGRLRWRPADTLDVNFGLYLSNDEIDENATAGVLVNCEDQIEQTSTEAAEGPKERLQNYCGRIPDLADTPDALDPTQFPNAVLMPDSVTQDSMPKNGRALGMDRDLTRGNLSINWSPDFGTITSLTGYSRIKQRDQNDFERSAGESIPLAYCLTADVVNPPACTAPLAWSRAPMGFIDLENGTIVKEWSQELRFTSPRDQRLRYVAGGYFFDSTLEARPGELIATTQLPGSILSDIAVGPVAYPTSLAIGTYIFGKSLSPDGGLDPLNRNFEENKEKSWSLFAATDFDVTDALEARAELRYTQDYRKSLAYNYLPCGDAEDLWFLEPGQTWEDRKHDAGNYPLNDYADIAATCGDDVDDLRFYDPRVLNEETGEFEDGTQSGTARFNSFTGRLGLKYQLENGWLTYGSIAFGEKPGGLNLLSSLEVINPDGTVESETVPNSFDPETMTAYELGIKGYTADRRIRLDMAVFYNDWKNVVLRQLTNTSPLSGRPFRQPQGLNVNAGDARVFGWEFTTDIGMTENLTGRATVAYTDSTLDNARQDTFALFPSFYTTEPSCAPAAIQALPDPDLDTDDVNEAQETKAAECRALSGDVAGNTQMRQPKWTGSVSLTYKRQLAGDWDWFTRADGSYTGKAYVGNDNQAWIPASTNVNLRLGAETPRYSVELWVRNLLNNDTPRSAIRDIYWTNDADMQGRTDPGTTTIRDVSTFDDFPPLRMSIGYPSLRTYGLVGKVRFGGAEK